MSARTAKVSFLPTQSGEHHQFGGGAVLTIGELSVLFGETAGAASIAHRLAELWNNWQLPIESAPDPADLNDIPF